MCITGRSILLLHYRIILDNTLHLYFDRLKVMPHFNILQAKRRVVMAPTRGNHCHTKSLFLDDWGILKCQPSVLVVVSLRWGYGKHGDRSWFFVKISSLLKRHPRLACRRQWIGARWGNSPDILEPVSQQRLFLCNSCVINFVCGFTPALTRSLIK